MMSPTIEAWSRLVGPGVLSRFRRRSIAEARATSGKGSKECDTSSSNYSEQRATANDEVEADFHSGGIRHNLIESWRVPWQVLWIVTMPSYRWPPASWQS